MEREVGTSDTRKQVTRIRSLWLILLLPAGLSLLPAQQSGPAWLEVARAERLMDRSEYGLAIQTLRWALVAAPNDPHALFGLGRAYRAIGDLDVAVDYFTRTLDHSERFVVPDERLLVRYELAAIHRERRDFARYQHELLAILADDPIPDDRAIPGVERQLAAQGIDRFLVLYRLPESGSTAARGMLGELFVGLGQYRSAAQHASLAVLQTMTTVIEAAIRRDPTYQFSTISDLMGRIGRYPEVQAYLDQSRLNQDLYYLAAAFWGEQQQVARSIWQSLATIDPDGEWGVRAVRQLADPQPEPLLVPTR